MRICIISPEGYPVPAIKGGAVETLIQSIIERNEIDKKLEIVCVARYDKNASEISKKYTNTKFEYFKKIPNNWKLVNYIINFIFRIIKKITKKDYKEILHCSRIYKKIKKYDFDFIVVEGGIPLSYKTLLNKYDYDKAILHIHGGDMVGDKQLSDTYKNFITLSEFLKNKFASTKYVVSDRIYVVHNGIDIELFDQSLSEKERVEIRKKYNINKDDIVIVFCGRLIKEKGVLELIKAIKNMKNKKDVKLLIVGNSEFGNNVFSDYEKELKSMQEELQDKIIFTGYVHNSNLNKLYKIADIGVVPSIWEEASPLVVVEEMVSGLPLIVTDSGGIPELVTKECAFLLKRDENLINNITERLDFLVENREIRLQMGENSLKNGKKYSRKQFFNEFTNSLEEIKSKGMV